MRGLTGPPRQFQSPAPRRPSVRPICGIMGIGRTPMSGRMSEGDPGLSSLAERALKGMAEQRPLRGGIRVPRGQNRLERDTPLGAEFPWAGAGKSMILAQPNSSIEEGSKWGRECVQREEWIGVERGQGQARPVELGREGEVKDGRVESTGGQLGWGSSVRPSM